MSESEAKRRFDSKQIEDELRELSKQLNLVQGQVTSILQLIEHMRIWRPESSTEDAPRGDG